MASLLASGIRPALHSVVGWLVLLGIAVAFVPTFFSSFADFSQAQRERAQYLRDCAGVPTTPGPPSGPCYVVSAMVSYDIGGLNTGDNTLYADIHDLPLNSSRV